jgi:hypothetical protein
MAKRTTLGLKMPAGMWLARIGILLLAGSLPVTGCVCDRPKPAEPVSVGSELCFFDFRERAEPPRVMLWPEGAEAPHRKRHELDARQQGGDLVATSNGADPYLVWDFENPTQVASLSVELFSDKGGPLQVFWATSECPVYDERCSTSAQMNPGEQTLDFLLDSTRPLRGLRLDLPGEKGATVALHRVRLLARPRLSTSYEPRTDHTVVEPTPDGIRISSKTPDPWIVLQTPWLDAQRVAKVRLELEAAAGTEPKLYWKSGSCPEFSESCQIHFEHVTGERDVFSAELAGRDGWSGRIPAVRVDPGEAAGVYSLRRLVFVRAAEKPK